MSDSSEEWSRAKAPGGSLDPDEVLSLALSMAPRCSQVHPPLTKPSKHPASPTSFFHSGLKVLQQTFSADAEEFVDVLSFLVDDESSLARVDVYCESGTVMTCRAVEAPDEAAGASVRRVVRRRCNIGALRRIFADPPSITQIDPGIVSEEEESKSTREPSPVRINRTARLMEQQSKLDSAQSLFIQEQEKKYLKRLRKDERMRQCVGNAILEGGIVDIQSFSSNEYESQPTPNESNVTGDDLPPSDIHEKQKLLKNSIEFADMGIAVLYGEAERLKKMMDGIKKEKEKHKTNADAGDEKSLSTHQSTDDGSSSSGTDTVMSEMARVLQGCEVEYSFNHEYHDVLEAALMGDDDSSDDSSAEESKTVRKLQKRGRSRPPSAFAGYSKKMSSSGKKSATGYPRQDQMSPNRQDQMSPITAIPTNGQSCIILREDGSFDTIGTLSDRIENQLFPKKGLVVPEQIFLGTKDRHFIRFRDGQFVFYGPPDLAKVLNQKRNRQRRGKNRNRGKREKMQQAKVTSLAFGKAIDDFFLVRSDGSWHSNGNLPEGLEDLLDKRNDNIDLEFVSIGPDDEWAVKDKTGRVYWGGVSDEVDERLEEILEYSDVFWIDFGLEESYFLLHK